MERGTAKEEAEEAMKRTTKARTDKAKPLFYYFGKPVYGCSINYGHRRPGKSKALKLLRRAAMDAGGGK
jgi:hypothetical protein